MNKIIGNIYKIIARVLDFLFDLLITILDFIVRVLDSGKKIIGAFGIFIFFILLNPLLASVLLFSSWFWILLILFFIVPVLGRGLINFLKYGQYVVTEFFYDRADFYLSDQTKSYKTFGQYSREYRQKQEDKRRREYEKRAREQEKKWEDAFRQFYEQSQRHGSYGSRQTGSSGSYYNPTQDFVKEYEDACRTLGLEPTTDKYEIKLAYRKKAKEYHPDINKFENATQIFQKINDANSFLSDENIERYKNIKGQ